MIGLRKFQRELHGNVATTFGLMAVALFGIAGLAIDAGRGYSAHSGLQTALDAAMLSAASRMNDANVDLADVARKYLENNWRERMDVTGITISIQRDGQSSLSGVVSAHVPTTLGRILGIDSLPIRVESQIVSGSQDVEAVLVLDNTGSMSGAKLDAPKQSSRTLIEAVFAGRDADLHAKIGIVPFAQYVNVGMGNRNKPWMSVPLDSTTNQCWDHYELISQSNCRMLTATGYNDGVPYSYQYESCDYVYAPPERRCADFTSVWRGCAGSRSYPLSTKDESYSTPIPGIMDAYCPSEITPITNNKQTLLDQVDPLIATGNTYIPSGLIWGWRVLSKSEPYDQAHEYNEVVNGHPVRKILVLMTDGANTLSATPPTHDGGDTTEANARSAELCSNIKANGIEVFTIAFDVTDAAIKSILRDCATKPSMFFDTNDASQLDLAFRGIARDLMSMHVAR